MNTKFRRAVSLVLGVLMLLGSMTFVSAAEEKSVDASMFFSDIYDGAYTNITDANEPIFNIEGFEPGDSVLKYLKLENNGNRAFSYDLNFAPEGTPGKLADVIDVYAAVASEEADISSMKKIGTLAEVFNGNAVSTGNILPAGLTGEGFSTGNIIVAVALKMHDEASDEYQGTTVGAFDTILNATEDKEFGDYPDKFAIKFENTDKYLYRVGNQNAVELGSLFKALPDVKVGNVSVNIEKLDTLTDVSYTYTPNADWTKGTIKFTGTGPVKVTITDDGKNNTTQVSLNLEVVSAYNVTTYSELSNRNSVLLADITMSSNGSFYLSNATLYGNGFTFDVTKGAYTGSGDVSGNYVVGLNNSKLDNIVIEGKVYTDYGPMASNNYNRATIISTGNNTILNSFISNCASPVRVNNGSIEIKNTTLKGGNFANLDIRNGNVILDNVTTINQINGNDVADDGTVIVGLGVVIYYENVLDTTTVEVKNGIKQYNYISQAQADEIFTNTYAVQLKNEIFNNDLSELQYNDGTDKWVNTGIVSMTQGLGDNNISDVDGYVDAYPYIVSNEGYVHTCIPTAESVTEKAPSYTSSKQGEIAPIYSFEYPTEGNKNYLEQTVNSKNCCYYDNGEIRIDFDKGGTSAAFDTQILTVSKHSIPLDYEVFLDGNKLTDTTVTFGDSDAGSHKLEYKYTDGNNYDVDANGNIITYDVEYTKEITVVATPVAPDAKNASFIFRNNTATEILEIGGNNYIVPTGVTSNSAEWGYITVEEQKVFYPITEATISKGLLQSGVTARFYVFKDVITITDYENAGTGNAVTYNSDTKSMPAGLSVVKGCYGSYTGVASAIKNDTALIQNGPENTFKYYSSSTASATPSNSSGLCYASPSNLPTSGRPESITIAQYRYVDNAGKSYYYYVGYHMANQETGSSGGSGCLAEGTLITLANGSTKAIENVTYDDKLLVWSFFDGKYDTVPAALIIDDGKDEYTVIALTFDDGTDIKLIDIHGLYDADLNKFVYIEPENVADYVGHNFVKTSLEGNTTAELVNYEVTTEYTGCYTIQSAMHVNCVADGFLTQTPPLAEGYFDYFEMGEGMQYDREKMQADIEKYGLYTYEDFDDYISYEAFMALNGPYLKVAVGKGYFDFDFLIEQIDLFGVGAGYPVAQSISNDDASIAQLNEEQDSLTDVVISSNNNITAAVYDVEITCDGAEEKDGVYTCTSNEAVFTITPNGTKGYVTITVDGDKYTVPVNSVYTLNVKNAYGKEVSFATGWGAAESTVTDNLIDLGELTIEAVAKTETGVTVTLSNTTKSDITGDLYIAVYDVDSRLVTVKRAADTEIKSKDTEKEIPFEVEVGENCTVKAFIWLPSDIVPLAAAIGD